MPIINTITEDDFVAAFRASETYKNNFSIRGLVELFNHLEELSDESGDLFHMDITAFCCEYAEDSVEDFLKNYLSADERRELFAAHGTLDFERYMDETSEDVFPNNDGIISDAVIRGYEERVENALREHGKLGESFIKLFYDEQTPGYKILSRQI